MGVDVTTADALTANEGLSSPGVKLHGAGFIVTPHEAEALGLGKRPGLERHIRPLSQRPRPDGDAARRHGDRSCSGSTPKKCASGFPRFISTILQTVKPERDREQSSNIGTATIGGYLASREETCARHLPVCPATSRPSKRPSIASSSFSMASILPDNMLVAIGSDDAFHLGVLSSRVHVTWALRAGGWLGVGNDPRLRRNPAASTRSPFPIAPTRSKPASAPSPKNSTPTARRDRPSIPSLTLTQMYNVLERVREIAANSPSRRAGSPQGEGGRETGSDIGIHPTPTPPHVEERRAGARGKHRCRTTKSASNAKASC